MFFLGFGIGFVVGVVTLATFSLCVCAKRAEITEHEEQEQDLRWLGRTRSL
jgi:hypothetical protein